MSDRDFDYEQSEPTQEPGSRRGCACCLLLIAGSVLGVLATLAWLSYQSTNPETAVSVLQEIAPVQIPPGYQGQMSFDMVGERMALLAPQGTERGQGAPFMLGALAIKSGESEELAKSKLEDLLSRQGGFTVDDRQEIQLTVRDQPLTGEEWRASDSGGNRLRIVFAIVPTDESDPGGQRALIAAGGQESSFDAQAWQALLDSVGR